MSLTGKTALVTGASGGIGAAIAKRLATDGAIVGIHYAHNREPAQQLAARIEAEGGQAFLVSGDLTKHAEIAGMFTQVDTELRSRSQRSTLDILVNNAGICLFNPISQLTEAEFDAQIAVNVRAPLFVIQQALPRLANHGRIINVSSFATHRARPHVIGYAMTKGALEVMTMTLAAELGPRGITVNAVAPGITRTRMVQEAFTLDPQREANVLGETALGRLGETEDIADIVGFLAGDAARWITGQIIVATGGASLR